MHWTNRIFAVWFAVWSGCAQQPPAPAMSAGKLIDEFEVSTEEGETVSDRITVGVREEVLLRCRLKPDTATVREYQGRPIARPEDWEVMFIVRRDGDAGADRPPLVFASLQPYPLPEQRVFRETVSVNGGPPRSLRFPAPPKEQSPDAIYGFMRILGPTSPGEYAGEFLVFPTADPRPQPGLMGNRVLGPPLTIRTATLVVP